MLDRLGDVLDGASFPYAIVDASGEDVESALEKERRRGGLEGFTPVLLGSATDVEMLVSVLDARTDILEEILLRAGEIDPERWFAEREATLRESSPLSVGHWPEEEPQPASLRSHRDVVTRRIEDTVYIARIPTRSPWEVPAHLGLGGFGLIPEPAAQVAISKRWFESHEAVVVAVTVDLVEYAVKSPPTERTDAESLAREHCLYSPDMGMESQGGVLDLAARLLNAGYWQFWWQ